MQAAGTSEIFAPSFHSHILVRTCAHPCDCVWSGTADSTVSHCDLLLNKGFCYSYQRSLSKTPNLNFI